MAFCRSCIEHAFGGVKNVFRYLARREKLQLDRANKRVQKLLSASFLSSALFFSCCFIKSFTVSAVDGPSTASVKMLLSPLLCLGWAC